MTQSERHQGITIESPRLLLVEGTDDRLFFQRILERRRQEGTQVLEYDGKDNLGNFLVNTLAPRLVSTDVVRVIGVTRDADDDFARAFQSLGDSLQRTELPVPSAPLTFADGTLFGSPIRVVTHIMPDNASPGDVDTLCLNAVSQLPAMPCVDRYFSCLRDIDHLPRQESKARLRAFLSANPDNPSLLIGQAIAAGVIPWNSPAFNGIHQLLDMLATVA